ncbi:MAG: tyrosine-type recombinase/integrase [Anaerolineales bacterium]
MLIDSGLRRGEALALDWEDVDLHTGAVHVRRGKGSKARVTYIGTKTKRGLLRWGGGQRSSAIFPLTTSRTLAFDAQKIFATIPLKARQMKSQPR